ncbi:nucleoside deaminase [Aliiroseovarius sediminis]|uniref:nucleoside deaminase n=1 Tax=Aliiroseovarius sediminis TaxID=2925839 RepID=UPI001F5AEA0C|nr:nucleoside deaminase [Aliiroseovarius sediminis]MCI2394482.1 nucleoside deaminase [Aliiroseovarius sediminis]
MTDKKFMNEAIELARDNVAKGGQPFGAVLVKDGKVLARAVNRMEADHDPTAHAELLALRKAGAAVGSTRLDGATVYASGQPCPMCLAAMRIAGVTRIAYAYSNEDGAPFGLKASTVAAELAPPLEGQTWASIQHLPPEDRPEPELYRIWAAKSAKQV